jgi:hypothetical protein
VKRPQYGILPSADRGVCGLWWRRAEVGIIAVLLLTMFHPEARGEGAPFFTFWPGLSSCGEYLLAVEGEQKARPVYPEPHAIYSMDYLGFVTFANGYLTGSNWAAAESEVGQRSDNAGRMVWLETYCRRNPLHRFAIALIKLREYLVKHGQ